MPSVREVGSAGGEGSKPSSVHCDQGRDRESSQDGLELSRELTPPPLPPRPKKDNILDHGPASTYNSLHRPKTIGRPPLQSKATTALSLTDVHPRGPGDVIGAQSPGAVDGARSGRRGSSHPSHFVSRNNSEGDESASVKSYATTLDARADVESLLGQVSADPASPAWRMLNAQLDKPNPFENLSLEDEKFDVEFYHEFDELEEFRSDGSNEEFLVNQFKSKLKHFLILSSAGKPIWSRHGDDQVISNYIGIIQTIISFYQGASDGLKGFTAADSRFVIMSKGPLNLVAISRLQESDAQLRAQLEALYMQILSTLTLPNMQRMFSSRPSTDLRRPLQGTEILLSALADGFTRGSPSTLLSALECLKLRKSHRQLVNDTLSKSRSQSLLYGLIVAGGRLVSVVRPKKHSLHPGDLQLIFNMLFEADSVKTGGGENWIPLCLPGFNNTGYLYMYVSFLSVSGSSSKATERPGASTGKENEVAILLISANKEGFFELRQMRDELVEQLEKNGSMETIKAAVRKGRPSCSDIVPGTVLRHFLYKSRSNVQFTMPSLGSHFSTLIAKRND
ncbi:Vacuolar fusion protein MON1 [Cryomyces minteri]|uniref:Vacuolar fusion protein MON1 n=1 Tax=Cryomyces minteri TaxID=331657 RepID=A0A4V6WL89_9PEZI|nr:Vacuolar fusion protein MON1 [Cryomyces minteri]